MDNLKLLGKHILLLFLYSPGKTHEFNEPIIGRTRIIKMMFLFDKEIKKGFLKNTDVEIKSFPEFFAWHYGPFSKQIYDDIEFFINNGFIENNPLDIEMTEFELDEYEDWAEDLLFDDEKAFFLNIPNKECFKLTPKGLTFIEKKSYSQLSNNQKDILKELKKDINNASLEALLRYTYLKYPNYTKKSKIKGRILG